MAEANEAPEWQCHACTCLNPESFLLCATCQTQRAPCTGEWECPRCNYINKRPKKGKKPACYWCTKLAKATGLSTKEEEEAPSERIDNNNNNNKAQAVPSAAHTASQPAADTAPPPAAITAPPPAAAPLASPCKPSFANQGRELPAVVVAKLPARPRTHADNSFRESAVALGRRAANNGKSVMRQDSGEKEQLQTAPKPQTSLNRSNGPYAASVPLAEASQCPVRTRPLNRDLTGLCSLPNEVQAKQKRMKMAENNDLVNKAECSNARQANGNHSDTNKRSSNGNNNHDIDQNNHHHNNNSNNNSNNNNSGSSGGNINGHALRDKHKLVKEDISNGRERHPIPAVNGADEVGAPFVVAESYDNEAGSGLFRYVAQSVSADGEHGLPASQRLTGCDCDGGDCLENPAACKCTGEARGDFCYDKDGRLKSRFAMDYRNCAGGGKGVYVYECNVLCACHVKHCGNRIVQKGIAQKLQVFRTKGKGWGVQALERIRARAFVFAYAGEILTNKQATERLENVPMARRCHTMELDADGFLEYEYGPDRKGLGDTDLLTIDASRIGNVASFLNHSCDPNLFYRPVLVDVHDTHCYTPSFFALCDIEPMAELTWDYGKYDAPDIDYIPSFKCLCGSAKCRDKRPPSRNGNGGRSR